MKKVLKWLGIILGSVIVIAAISVVVIVIRFNNRMNKDYVIAEKAPTIPTDSASIAKGKQFTPFCQACHGDAFQGKVFFTDPQIGTIYSPNLTRGVGGVGRTYTNEDWFRSIRHGVNPKGKPLFVMPSGFLNKLSENDLACLIAYIKQVPPVDNAKGKNIIPVFTKILMQLDQFGEVFAAETIDHSAPYVKAPERAPNKEYGEYLVNIMECKNCHSENLTGGKSPDPNSPQVPNISKTSKTASWSKSEFIATLRTGITPDKRTLNDTFMAWRYYGQLEDNDLIALHEYVKNK